MRSIVIVALILLAGCGGEDREVRHNLVVKLYHYTAPGQNTLSAYDALQAFEVCSDRWERLFGESLNLIGFDEVPESVDRSTATSAEQELATFKSFSSHVPAGIARLAIMPAVKISDDSEQIYSGGLANYWDQVAVVFVGNRLTKNRVGVDRAAALICHELQHLRGLTDDQIQE